jgi:site-specific DNA recombinase
MSKRAVIYARVSSDVQRNNYSIPTQISECITYAKSRSYTLLGGLFVDLISGKDVTENHPNAIPAYVDDYTSRELSRPSLDASLEYLESYGFDILIVHALDRLARDPYIRQTLEREFNKRGARVEYVLGAYDESPEGEVRKDLDATFAKWENAKRVERSLRGKYRKAQSGKWVHGMPPYGYSVDIESDGGLAVIPEQADVVRKIFDMYITEHYSIREIIEVLNQDGSIPKKGGNDWAKSSINHILENTIYIGHCFFNKTKRVGTRDIVKDRQDWIRIDTPPIISAAIFEKARLRRKENQKTFRKRPKHEYLLNGLITCSECQHAYSAQTSNPGKNHGSNGTKSYRHRKDAGHCMNKQISTLILDKIVWDKILNILLNPMALEEGYEQMVEQQKQNKYKKIAQVETLERALVKVKQKRQNLNNAYLDPDIQMSKVEYLGQKDRFDKEAHTIEQDIENFQQELASIPQPADLETLKNFSAEIAKGLMPLEEFTVGKKRHILELMHVKVIYHPDGRVELDGWYTIDEVNAGLLGGSSSYRAVRWCNRPPPQR